MLATFKERRDHEAGLATPDLMMSRAEVERRGSTGVNSSHNVLVWNDSGSSTSMQRGPGTVRRGGVGAQGMEHSTARHGMGAQRHGQRGEPQ
jgi:hypothetical protein